ncbi:MAG: 30S ribosomal protein S6 [Candidatus Paceibacterota bacterium]|jgi:ribosomal protein S6
MSFYEINLLLSSKLSQEEANSIISSLESLLQKNGKLTGEKTIEIKKLAYPILKEEEAWFCFLTLYPEKGLNKKEMLDAVEKQIKEEKNILRHLILKKEEIKIKKSEMRVAAAAASKEEARSEKAEKEKTEKEEPKEETIEETPEDSQKKVELEDVEEKINEMLGE